MWHVKEIDGYQHHKPNQTVEACDIGKDSRLVPPLYLLSPSPLERPTSEAKMAWRFNTFYRTLIPMKEIEA